MEDVFTALNPILIVSKCIGLGPFYIDRKNKKLKVSLPGMTFSATILMMFVMNASFFTYTKVVFKDERIESYIGMATDMILLACGITVTICSILFTIIMRHKYVQVVQSFYSVNFEMIKLNQHVPYKTILNYSRMHLAGLFTILLLLLLHSVIYIQRVNTVLYISYMCSWFVPKIYNFLMELQFVSGALLLKSHYNLLNLCLIKFNDYGKKSKDPNKIFDIGINNNAWMDTVDAQLNTKMIAQTFTIWEGNLSKFRSRKIANGDTLSTPNPELLEKIKVIRKTHSNLCEIKEFLNSSFSLQLLTSVAQAFVYITANLYMIFTTLSSPNKVSIMSLSYPIIWTVTHTIELVILVVTCTKTSKAANHTAVLVHKLLVKECSTDLRNQLKLFSIQLLHRKISFTASGFFNLDMTLLQAIIGAATTYLVILIQFHNTYEVPNEL